MPGPKILCIVKKTSLFLLSWLTVGLRLLLSYPFLDTGTISQFFFSTYVKQFYYNLEQLKSKGTHIGKFPMGRIVTKIFKMHIMNKKDGPCLAHEPAWRSSTSSWKDGSTFSTADIQTFHGCCLDLVDLLQDEVFKGTDVYFKFSILISRGLLDSPTTSPAVPKFLFLLCFFLVLQILLHADHIWLKNLEYLIEIMAIIDLLVTTC